VGKQSRKRYKQRTKTIGVQLFREEQDVFYKCAGEAQRKKCIPQRPQLVLIASKAVLHTRIFLIEEIQNGRGKQRKSVRSLNTRLRFHSDGAGFVVTFSSSY